MNERRTPPDHLSIGAFARQSRLSLKALRLYDQLGLLLPAYVDPDSNYRYYHISQLQRANLIGRLRQLDLPLQTIREVVELPGPDAARRIATYWYAVEAEMRIKRKLVHYLDSYLHKRGDSMYRVETRHIPEQKLLTIQRRVYAKDLPGLIDQGMGMILAHLAAHQLQQSGPSMVIYHGQVNHDSDGPVEVCVPFTGTVEPSGELRVRLEPAHTEAFTRITKNQVEFPEILKAYDAVHAWVMANGRSGTDSPREVYFANWMTIGPDDPACDIAWPCT